MEQNQLELTYINGDKEVVSIEHYNEVLTGFFKEKELQCIEIIPTLF
jgi:hypothetical protein